MSVFQSPSSSIVAATISPSRPPSRAAPSTVCDTPLLLDRQGPRSSLHSTDLSSELARLCLGDFDVLTTSDSIQNLGDTLKTPQSPVVANATLSRHPTQSSEEVVHAPPDDDRASPPRPFQKWVKSFHRKARQRPSPWSPSNGSLQRWLWGSENCASPSSRLSIHRKSSSSGSSFRLVSAVRSASVSLASVSAMTRSVRQATLSQCLSRTDRSSRASLSGPRISEDSAALEKSDAVDAAAIERSLQRRRILEELISTEEGYIGDVRFLMNVYVTILASLPTMCMGLRSSINQNLADIVELHEEILGELHRAVPHSEYTQLQYPPSSLAAPDPSLANTAGHRRWASLDAVLGRNNREEWLQSTPGMLSEPQVAAEVSKVFAKKVNRFFIYKEYGAKYEMMMKDVASANQAMPQWETFQKGLEALATILSSVKNAEERSRKALTIADLLVKPIQRVCKYPLLFAELLKYTPVSDCPNSHMEVDGVLTRLREATAEINRATNDSQMKATLERSWLLQDRLQFPSKKLDAASKNRVRAFGHIRLCGTLHVCWQTNSGVDGHYLICLLYRDILCLASAGKVDPVYIIRACIDLGRAKVEDADNGRGIQCHTAPFSWKLVFECDHQLYEMIMTACSPKEEMEWRARLARPAKDHAEGKDSNPFSCLDLEMKSLGTVFGKPGTIARRVSIHRATTVGPKSPLWQVVLKNTSVVRDSSNSSSTSLTINRSQSLLTTNARMPVLAPARSERARLEGMLSDVWTREILPFPGMTTRARSEHLVRTSASTVMRKLSVASIASSFSKRSSSLTQRGKAGEESSREASSGKRRGCKSSTDEAGLLQKNAGAEAGRRTKRPRIEKTIETEVGKAMLVGASGEASGAKAGRVESMKRAAAKGRETAALRASSANSPRRRRSRGCSKSSSARVEKENTCGGGDDEGAGRSRWGRGMGPRSEASSYGFRSLFR